MRCAYCEKKLLKGDHVYIFIDGDNKFYVHKECEPELRASWFKNCKSPCLTCKKRHVGCHAECLPYKRYARINAVRRITEIATRMEHTHAPAVGMKEIIYE